MEKKKRKISPFPLARTKLSPRAQQKISDFLAKETSQLMREATAFLQEKVAFLERKENWFDGLNYHLLVFLFSHTDYIIEEAYDLLSWKKDTSA
jgi:hypothetical protein